MAGAGDGWQAMLSGVLAVIVVIVAIAVIVVITVIVVIVVIVIGVVAIVVIVVTGGYRCATLYALPCPSPSSMRATRGMHEDVEGDRGDRDGR